MRREIYEKKTTIYPVIRCYGNDVNGESILKNGYTGKKTLYFTINPKATSISSVASATKGFTVKWKKLSTQTSGYQIRYATKSSMSGAKITTIASNKTISKNISGLTKKKKYYVQVRTYKTVSSVKYYSSWSNKRSVTTK